MLARPRLYWDRDDRLSIDLTGKHPMFRILGELEKGGRDRMLPMAPEFAQMLDRVPESDRKGLVFKIKRVQRNDTDPVGLEWASKVISEIGKKAQVAVGKRKVRDKKTGELCEVPKYASAHDLRRSFGSRWCVRVMPPVLQELMRHEDINTTLKYYVGQNAQRTANAVWEAFETAGPVTSFVTTNTDGVDARTENPSTV